MKARHKRLRSDKNFVSEEGQRNLLCRNKKSLRCPSFDINPNTVPEKIALDYLASILVEMYLDDVNHENNK